jgi:hypothetical protein
MPTTWVFEEVADTLEGLGAHCSFVAVGVLNAMEPEASNQYAVAARVSVGAYAAPREVPVAVGADGEPPSTTE